MLSLVIFHSCRGAILIQLIKMKKGIMQYSLDIVWVTPHVMSTAIKGKFCTTYKSEISTLIHPFWKYFQTYNMYIRPKHTFPFPHVWKRVIFQFLTGIPTSICAQDHLVILSQASVNSYKGHPALKPLCLQTADNNRHIK